MTWPKKRMENQIDHEGLFGDTIDIKSGHCVIYIYIIR